MPENLYERVLKTVRNYDMLEPGDSVLAAVSGGPDSVFLVRALVALKRKLKLKKVAVCNLDHGLRGEESKKDSAFVKGLARKLGLEYFNKNLKVKELSSKKMSTEESARQARYKFYREAAAASGSNVVATGHTLDDQAETVLMRIIKGSSLKGAVGIVPTRSDGTLKIIRPLLELEKASIVRLLDSDGVSYRIDRTNLEPVYFRNIIRSRVIPFLEEYNPRLKRALFNLAEHLREDFEFVRLEKSRRRDVLKEGSGDSLEISIKDIAVQPKAMQKEILRDALDRAGGLVKKLSFRHWKEMENFIKHKRAGSSLDLPGGIRMARSANKLVLNKLRGNIDIVMR